MKKLILALALVSAFGAQAQFSSTTLQSNNIPVALLSISQPKPAPTIIVAHDCNGVTKNHTAVAEKVAGWGYNVVVPDSFRGRGITAVCKSGLEVTGDERTRDFLATIEWIRTQPWHQGPIGVLGFSHGAGSALTLSTKENTGVSAIVAYYPPCNRHWYYASVKTPIQIHTGTADTMTPSGPCEAVGYQNRLADVHVYSGTTHSFNWNKPDRVKQGHELRYDPKATAEAEALTREFFRARLGL